MKEDVIHRVNAGVCYIRDIPPIIERYREHHADLLERHVVAIAAYIRNVDHTHHIQNLRKLRRYWSQIPSLGTVMSADRYDIECCEYLQMLKKERIDILEKIRHLKQQVKQIKDQLDYMYRAYHQLVKDYPGGCHVKITKVIHEIGDNTHTRLEFEALE